jgi:hypothetical protein
MFPRSRLDEASTFLREMVVSAALASLILVALALFPSRRPDAPAHGPAMMHLHPLRTVPPCDARRDPLEPCDPAVEDSTPGEPDTQARTAAPLTAPEGAPETDEC